MSTHNIGFYEDLTKVILNYHQISSNMHLISSAETTKRCLQNNNNFLFQLVRYCHFGVSPVNYSDSELHNVENSYTRWHTLAVSSGSTVFANSASLSPSQF